MKLVPISKALLGRPVLCTPMSHFSYISHPIWNILLISNAFLHSLNLFASGSMSRCGETRMNHCILSGNPYETSVTSPLHPLQALQEVTVLLDF
jgi:hypothetical protein